MAYELHLLFSLFALVSSSEPGDCNFDRDFCNWTNEQRTDDFDWLREKGSSPSLFTGPSADHTSGQGWYIYNEASAADRRPGHTARLHSPLMAGPKCMTFFSNLYGEWMSLVRVYVTVSGRKTLAWLKSGNRGDRWIMEQVFINETGEYMVTLEVTQGRSWSGDAAIDDISFTNGSCAQETRLFHVSSTNGIYRIDTEPQTDNWFNQFSFLARRTTGNLKEQMFYVYDDYWVPYGYDILQTDLFIHPNRFPMDFFYDSTGSLYHSRPVFAVKRSGQAQQVVLARGDYEGCCMGTVVLSINVQVIEDHQSSCFPGWISSGSSGCLRFYVNDKRTWDGARVECRRIGGDLATIHDSNALVDTSKILETITSALAPFHVGMRDTVTNVTQHLTWIDGKTVPRGLWKSGYPKTGDNPLCAGVTEIHPGLVLHACSLLTGFICQRSSVDMAAKKPTNSSAEQSNYTRSSFAVDGFPNTCFYTKASSPWWSVDLLRSMYVFSVEITSNMGCCHVGPSNLEVLVIQGARAQRCGDVMPYGSTDWLKAGCYPIRGRSVMITLDGANTTLILCKVTVQAYESAEVFRGVRQDIWYKLINTQGLATMRENHVYSSSPQGVSWGRVFETSQEVSEDHGQLITSYFQPPSSGLYDFLVSCDDECELWISGYQEPSMRMEGALDGVGRMLVQIQKWDGYNDSAGCLQARSSSRVRLASCMMYVLSLYVKSGATFNCLGVGMETPEHTIEEPISNKHLFAVPPGVRQMEFDIIGPTLIHAALGSTLAVKAKYIFCCVGIYCPNCTIKVEFLAFGNALLVSDGLRPTCTEMVFTTILEAVVQPGLHLLEVAYSFVNDSAVMATKKQVGEIQVKVAFLQNLTFADGLQGWFLIGWKIGFFMKHHKEPYAYISEPVESRLESPILEWKPFLRVSGACVRFSYLMPQIEGSPELQVYLNSTTTKPRLLWKLSGYHGTEWLQGSVQLDAEQGTKIEFMGVSSINGSVAIAIDDIMITTEKCATSPLYAAPGYKCAPYEFQCTSGHCISGSSRCDGDYNCMDRSDEDGCKCFTNELTCSSGRCVQSINLCDGVRDCEYGLDELRCGDGCKNSEFLCPDSTCIPWSSTCNQSTQASHCQDEADRPAVCGSSVCPLNSLNCKDNIPQNAEKCRFSFKGRCDFESGLCGLRHGNTTRMRWSLATGNTPTEDTGPSFDHTTYSNKGSFVYIEASREASGSKAWLSSDWMNPGSAVCIQFWYHMYGVHVGSLSVLAVTRTDQLVVWRMAGNKGDRWIFGQTMIYIKGDFKFVIEGIRGDGNLGDIALDDLALLEGRCNKVEQQMPVSCSFESSCGGWDIGEDWEMSSSESAIPLRPNEGRYLFLKKRASSPSQVLSPIFPAGKWRCLRFWYYIGLGNTAELRIRLRREGNETDAQLGATSRRTNEWTFVQLSMEKVSHTVQVTFEAFSTGPALALDDVSFLETQCEDMPWTPYADFLPPPQPKCSESLGMQNFKIPDSAITASSFQRERSAPRMGRLHLAYRESSTDYTGGWCIGAGGFEYLQVDLGSEKLITKVSTQGKQEFDFWVTEYVLSILKGGSWSWYIDSSNKIRYFDGNSDRHTVVSHRLLPSVQTRYIRIHPLQYSKYACLRVDFFGCSIDPPISNKTECGIPLGIQNGRITDAAITASSSQGAAHRARLHTVGEGGKPGAWVAGVANLSQWLQIDFGGVAMVTRIATQGRHVGQEELVSGGPQHWVTRFKVSFSQLGRAYEWYKINGSIVEFSGNSDISSVVHNDVNPQITGRYFRLHPVTWNEHPAMRVEMYGCLAVTKGIKAIENLGCFKSKGPNPTLPSLENIDPGLEGGYQQRAGAILRCADAAFHRGYEVFGIQDGGKCVAGGMSDYGGNGGSLECADNGRGANGANEVYRIHRECAWGHELCTWTSKGGNGTWMHVNVTDLRDAFKGGDDDGVETVIFPNQTQLNTRLPIKMTNEITLCYWVTCDLSRLEVAMETQDGNTVIGFTQRHCALQLKVLGNTISCDYCVCNKIWRHVCVTWKSHAGVWEIYLDGQVVGFGRWLSARLTLPETTHISIFHDAFNSSSPTKLTSLSAWGHVIVPEEIMRMSYGCGDVKGDIMNWESLFKLMRVSYRTERQADCRIAKGGMLLNISSNATVLSSPWFNRSGSEYESCMRFRYLATGRRTARLVVSLRVEGDPMGERPVWGVGGDDGRAWRYGQVVIGTVTRYQVSFKAESADHSSVFALGGVWFSSGYCATTPPIAGSACNEHFTAPYGNITSPNYPGYYPRDTNCEWRITAPVDHVIRITFRSFHLAELLRCTGDYLELHDGIPNVSHKSSVIGRFCGNYYAPVVESSANQMAVVFKSSSSGAAAASGFWLYYEVFENKDVKSCSGSNAECPASCTCYQSSGNTPRFVVEGRLLSAVPRDIPEYTAVLLLKRSRIIEVKKSDFASLASLEYLDLSGNIILRLQDGAFSNLPSIKDIKLSSNFIQKLRHQVFKGLSSIETLDVSSNILDDIGPATFSSMTSLRVLSLRDNHITLLEDLFQNCTNLTHLYLQNNKIEQISDETLKSLKNLRVLYLNNNKIKRISQDSFLGLESLQTLKLDHFTLCCYASLALPNVDCQAPANEFSSCDDLMKDKTLQVCIWVLGIFAFFGNIFVVAYRLVVREDNRVHSLLLTNLAISDFMMGLYLLIIAFKDVQWQGEYFKHDLSWQVSGLCQFAGALSMISSEVSVLMLTIITLDRFICIVFPMRFGRLGLKKAIAICILLWTFGTLISVVPILGIEYFHDKQLDIGFYGRSSVCLPLQLSSDRPAGWEYSVSFFIGLNFIAFMFILLAYIAMFWTVRKSSAAVGSRNAKKESALARKLMVIILTDFCCWMPVILIGILSLTGNFHDPQKLAYVWIAVFVLPVNSSINPILYTFSTAHVKKRVTQYSRSMSGFVQNTMSSTASIQASPGHSPRRADKKHVIAKKVSPIGSLTTLKITGRAEILPETGNGVGYIKCLVSGATTERLLKVFPGQNSKEFKREVAVLTKINSGRDHDNLLNYRWHQKGESLVFDLDGAKGINLNSNYRVICFDYSPSMSALRVFLREAGFKVSLETLLAIFLDALMGVEHLHKHGVAHGNINQDTVLVCQTRKIPFSKACIGGYETARVISGRGTDAYRKDVRLLGKLQQLTLRSCGHDKDLSAQIREVIDMCYWDSTNWKLRVSEIRQQLEQAWISTNDWDTCV
ncbi:uncharacterized protein LOC5517708 isoform X2 [Nematostella vectensis]|uniref:uncharacterized protein LOC5517708 isoform X2 n=1 Tax=Nematostella vectensis TaxID=45351 RepID=UPI00207776DD|nr:uncharacterized protein LOC5517708 isoform X2 [Nematostella vectensis]